MKNYKIVLLTTMTLVLASCGKWLTIDPQDQIKEGVLYSTASGFHTQINGIYRTMSSTSLYGRELSYGIIEAIAQVYDGGSYTTSGQYNYINASKYDYDYFATKSIISGIWENAYNAITNCNSVIAYAEVADSMLFKNRDAERKCILGEAYALRALLHFDIMRLYAPSLKVNSTGLFVPYLKTFPERFTVKTPQNEYIANVITDLEKAHELTAYLDTNGTSAITNISFYLELAGGSGGERFLQYRGYRLNHYAIKALLARVYLYAGDEENALKYSQELIGLHTEKRFFQYNSTYDVTGNFNSKMYKDIIFAGYNNNLSRFYLDVNPKIGTSYPSDYLSLLDAEGIYGNEVDNDIRYKNLTRDVGGVRISTKYLDNSSGSTSIQPTISLKLIPMIRMSEMYYIAAECIYNTDKAKAESYLNYVRGKRNVKILVPNTTNKDEFIQLILNDVRREQVCEGQLFYFYKRLNLPVIKVGAETITLTDKQIIFPIPDSENIL